MCTQCSDTMMVEGKKVKIITPAIYMELAHHPDKLY
jgi:hypothetical protein